MRNPRYMRFLPAAVLISVLLFRCGGGGSPAPGTSSLPPIATTQAATSVTTSGAVLNGLINPNGIATDVWFEYGLMPDLYSANQTAKQAVGSGIVDVSVNNATSGFTSGTTYYYRVCASSAAGVTYGTIMSCTTGSPGSAPTVQTLTATNIGVENATVNGLANPNGLATTVYFEWGLDSRLDSSTTTTSQSIGSGNSNVAVNAALTGLTDNTTYYCRVAAQSISGTTRGNIVSFTTTIRINRILYWDPPTRYTDNTPLDPASELSTFEIYVNETGTFLSSDTPRVTIPAVQDGTGVVRNSIPLSELGTFMEGHRYYISIRDVAINGERSGFSTAVAVSF